MLESKKRKIISKQNFHFPKDILIYISQFLNKLQDFKNFAITCKNYFEDLILNNNYCINNFFLKTTVFGSSFGLDGNEIIKKIPEYIKNNIKYLNLITDNLNLDNFTKLEELLLEGRWDHLKENCLQNLKDLKKLTIKNQFLFTGEYLQKLINLKSLQLLHCKNIDLKCVLPLQNLTHLEISDIKFNNLKLPKNITSLKLSGCNVVDDNLIELINLQKLEIRFEPLIVGKFLQNCKQLKYLLVFDCPLNGDYFKTLENLKTLFVINYEDCENIHGVHLQYLKNLERLHLEGVLNVKDSHLTHLTQLTRFKCGKVDGTCLQYFKKLKHLVLDKPVKDECLKQCTELEYFEIIDLDSNILTGEFLTYLKNIKYVAIGTFVLRENDNFLKVKEVAKTKYVNDRLPLYCSKKVIYFNLRSYWSDVRYNDD
ncbi:hypothetical protein ABK040_007701 [Willaertia magna]